MAARIIIVYLILFSILMGQELKKYYDKIENKVELDDKYLDIYSVEWEPQAEDLTNINDIPRLNEPDFSFQVSERVIYHIVFIKETIEIDSLTIIRVEEEKTAAAIQEDQGFFGGTQAGNESTRKAVLSFADLNELYFNRRFMYDELTRITKNLIRKYDPNHRLGITVDDIQIKSRGISSSDNQDYINYMRVNSRHLYPVDETKANKQFVSRRDRKEAISGSDYTLDVSTSGVSFYTKEMNFNFSLLSAEVSMDDDLMNIHAWEGMFVKAGIRSLVFLSRDTKDINDDYIIDLRLMGRIAFDMSSLSSNIPFLFIESPKLNVGSGVVFDIHASRISGIPFLNLYFSGGSQNLEDPSVKFGTPDSSYAYFSFNQWATTMSFYWNASEERTLRFRMDLGMGSYSVVKATYYNSPTDGFILNSESAYQSIQPLLIFYFNFVPKRKNIDNELFATKLKLFDSVLKADFWMKLLEFSGGHTFRFEASFISSPFYRSRHAWENESSTMVGLRYRYGF